MSTVPWRRMGEWRSMLCQPCPRYRWVGRYTQWSLRCLW